MRTDVARPVFVLVSRFVPCMSFVRGAPKVARYSDMWFAGCCIWLDTANGDLRRRSQRVGCRHFVAAIWKLVFSADCHPNGEGVRDRDRSFGARCWPIVICFSLFGLGRRCLFDFVMLLAFLLV